MPNLRILGGPDPDHLEDITALVNTGRAHAVRSDAFEGSVAMYINGFPGDDSSASKAYFSAPDRKGCTWSIQSQGRFLQPHSADAILFGNTFERTLNLPWGAGAALKLMKYVDPTVQQDLGAKQRPYALSPLAATMPHLVASAPDAAPAFPGTGPVGEDTAVLGLAPAPKNAEARRKHFQDAGRRQATTFGPDVVLTSDFCYGYLAFSPRLALKLPGGVSIDLQRHWDGQQVHFTCCERGPGPDGRPWGRVYWCIVVEPAGPDVAEAAPAKEGAPAAEESKTGADVD